MKYSLKVLCEPLIVTGFRICFDKSLSELPSLKQLPLVNRESRKDFNDPCQYGQIAILHK